MNDAILQYINRALDEGYTPSAVRQTLLQSQYPPQLVEESLSYVINQRNVGLPKKGMHLDKKMMAITLIAIAVVAVMTLIAWIIISSLEKAAPADTPPIEWKYIPKDEEKIEIIKQQPRDDNIIVQVKTDEPTQEEAPVRQAPQDSQDLLIEQAVLLAPTDANGALDMCLSLTAKRSTCLSRSAAASEDPALCSYITEQESADSCYLGFARDKKRDVTICDNIKNYYVAQSCIALYSMD